MMTSLRTQVGFSGLLGRTIAFSFLTIASLLVANNTDCEEDRDLALNRLSMFPEVKEWNVEVKDCIIYLRSKFDITAFPPFAIAIPEDQTTPAEPQQLQPFEISIRFEPMMDYGAYLDLKQRRQLWADKINRDYQMLDEEPLSNEDLDLAWNNLNAIEIPTHLAAYSNVFIKSTLDNDQISIDPDLNLQKCIWMLYRINFLFSEIVE
ncbi:MAG: hypothetical protein MI748_06145 [Opitutales bacterium]|nr:hypothetical protein [Opitutales bacterium]